MTKPFFERLYNYYDKVAQVLRGEADSASVFANTTDIGQSRERVYAEFLRRHAPSKCNVFLGGFLFHDLTGEESKQLDVIVTTDTTPKYDFHNPDGGGKSFSPVEGTLAVASIKSTLNKSELYDALDGISSIPPTRELGNRISYIANIPSYDDWPHKIIYASDGISGATIMQHLESYYTENSDIPLNRRPHMIHVAGKYVIVRLVSGMSISNADGSSASFDIGNYHIFISNPDIQAITWVLNELQKKASASSYIIFSYDEMRNQINNIFRKRNTS